MVAANAIAEGALLLALIHSPTVRRGADYPRRDTVGFPGVGDGAVLNAIRSS